MKSYRWIALLVLLLAGALMALGPAEQPRSQTNTLPDGTDSKIVAEVLAQQRGQQAQTAIVLVEGDQEGERLDVAALHPLAERAGGPMIPNSDGSAAVIPVEFTAQDASDNAQQVATLRKELQQQAPPGVRTTVTGPSAVQADLAAVFEGANFLLLGVTALIVALLLIVTYRSPVLWLIPLLVIAVADRLAQVSFTWVLDAAGVTWDESTSGILSVLVFGAGTNYALLLISRYRDELTRHECRFEAMAAAWRPTLRAVSMSALTVVLGVACLLLSAVPNTRGLGVGSMVGIVIAWVFGALVLPGILVFFGRWIFWPRRPAVGQSSSHGVWDRVSTLVRRQPVAVFASSLVLLGLLSAGALGITTGLRQSDQFIDTPESISAAQRLEERFPGQDATPAQVVFGDDSQRAGLAEALQRAGATVQPQRPGDGQGEYSVLTVAGLDTAQLREVVSASPVPDAKVGGQDAQLYDQNISAARDRMLIFPAVLLVVFLVLMVAFRSLLAPLVMVATVLLTNVAALGLGWWISRGVFGFDVFADTTPLYAFVFLVALGIDYTIFLIARAREEAQTVGTREGVLRSLSATGGVITSAGVLLAAVFAALGVLPLVVLAQLGIVIFVGVLLDTLVVRTLLVPATVQLLGERFWWPGVVGKRRSG